MRFGTTIVNAFVRPQCTVLQDGDGFPRFALFFGLNLTFGGN